ncbi:hydroxymyristoyl-ACP dehydratase [Pasteurella skyensis]|uniref:Hydroxymyristoyl-ACP dehydratase n=1 Tax=Phocoenobacter skyensis TaxID=97481 RepID=A0AAJ6NCC3_9PAST|nr:hydroxymyristoyl-ACP dehydratase [Pasteurella skyensis]MDP8169894.1 hydroxymyristoyl-ACP dehydratase [Pasteurella skyensis]MDP8174170.1 hydroxymyristoyl-ACP dehydratase [Pasteurella skyensis]
MYSKKDPIWLDVQQQENMQISIGKVPLDLVYLKDHFADFPLVPGVIELQWVTDKITQFIAQEVEIKEINKLKFQKFLCPNDVFELMIKWEEDKNRIIFTLKTENEMCSSGIILI